MCRPWKRWKSNSTENVKPSVRQRLAMFDFSIEDEILNKNGADEAGGSYDEYYDEQQQAAMDLLQLQSSEESETNT
jgi:hypothetical protein